MARTIAEDHDEKRAAILKIAAKSFAESGFDRASMSQIARQCGISKASIYHYYTSKDELLFEVLDQHMQNLVHKIAAVKSEGIPPEEYLHQVIEVFLMVYLDADDQHRAQLVAENELSKERLTTLLNRQREVVRIVNEAIIAIRPDRYKKDGELHAITMTLFGALNWYYMWNHNKNRQSGKEYARTVCNLLLNGINNY
ncbi:MAG: TetR/AcrR family transcriptional regulator [Rhizobiaceae bacterium]|nr:TetR/AcrR family transcriptional regulator [Rhizobiaceae bacterium]